MGFAYVFFAIAGICFVVIIGIVVSKLKAKIGSSSSSSSSPKTPKDFDSSFAYDHTVEKEKVCSNCGYHRFTKTILHYRCQRCAQTFSYYDYQNLSPYTGDHPELGIYNVYPKSVLDRCLSKFDEEYKNKFQEKYHMTIKEYYKTVLDFKNSVNMYVSTLYPTDYKGEEQLSISIFENFILYKKNYPGLSGKCMIEITDPYAYLEDVYRPISCVTSYKEIGEVDEYGCIKIQVSFQGLPDLTYTTDSVDAKRLPFLEWIAAKGNVKKESVEKEVTEFKVKYGYDWAAFSRDFGIRLQFLMTGHSLTNDSDFVTIKHFGKCFTAVPKSRNQVFEKLLEDRVPNLDALKEFVYVDSDIINKTCKRDSYNLTINHKPNILDAAVADAAFGTAGVAMYVAENSGSETIRADDFY